jgi:hypothetical protein
MTDAGVPDSGVPDSGVPDAGIPDAGMDAGVDAGTEEEDGRGTILGLIRPRCGDAGFCWENPVAGDQHLLAVRGNTPSDFWAVGTGGTVLHWNGTRWERLDSRTQAELRSVWVAPNGTVWVAGRETLSQLRDGGWHPQSVGSNVVLNAVDGPPDAGRIAYAVGSGSLLLARDGGTWVPEATDLPPPAIGQAGIELTSVWAPAPEVGWAVGAIGRILGRDAGTWSSVIPITDVALRAIHGSRADSAFAVGQSGVTLRWNGSNWARSSTVSGSPPLLGVWEASPGRAWVVSPSSLYSHSGGLINPVAEDSPQPLNALWGAGEENLWAVGNHGAILRSDGGGFREVPGGFTRDINGVWGPNDGGLWGVGAEFVAMRTNEGRYEHRLDPTVMRLNAVTAGLRSVVAAGEGGLVSVWTSSGWTRTKLESVDLYAISAEPGGGRIWTVGNSGTVNAFDGTFSDSLGPPAGEAVNLRAVWVTPSGAQVLMAGQGSAVYRRNTSGLVARWDRLALPSTADIYGLWGAADDDAWAVGTGGQAFRYNGSTFTQTMTGNTTTTLRAVHGTDRDDVWAAGDNGLILRRVAGAWTTVPSGTTTHFRAIWVTARDVWVAGDNGAILHLAR